MRRTVSGSTVWNSNYGTFKYSDMPKRSLVIQLDIMTNVSSPSAHQYLYTQRAILSLFQVCFYWSLFCVKKKSEFSLGLKPFFFRENLSLCLCMYNAINVFLWGIQAHNALATYCSPNMSNQYILFILCLFFTCVCSLLTNIVISFMPQTYYNVQHKGVLGTFIMWLKFRTSGITAGIEDNTSYSLRKK